MPNVPRQVATAIMNRANRSALESVSEVPNFALITHARFPVIDFNIEAKVAKQRSFKRLIFLPSVFDLLQMVTQSSDYAWRMLYELVLRNSCILQYMSMPGLGDRKRLEILDAFQILDTPAEPIFDRLTQFAAIICNVPIATISLVDAQRQWFKSAIGLDATEIDLSTSFCAYTIQSTEPMIVEDLSQDSRFSRNPLVAGSMGLRFYAGLPLVTADGYAIGTLAAMDYHPRQLHGTCLETLKMLAEQAMVHIELRRQRRELDQMLAERTRMYADLQRQAHQYREAQRIARLGSWEMALPSRSLNISEETYRIFGIAQQQATEDFSAFLGSVHVEDRSRLEAALVATLRGEAPLDIIHRIVRPGGEVMWVHERGELQPGREGQTILAGTVQDITEQRKSQEELQLLHACIARVDDIVMITEAEPYDEPGPRLVFANAAFERRTGFSRDEVLGRSPRLLQGPKTQVAERARIREALQKKMPVSVELINYTKSGEEFWLEIDIAPVALHGGEVTHFVSVQRDITQRKAVERQIERLAYFDSLTQLPNRRLLMDRLQHALQMVDRNQNSGALLFIDLDNFKSLNDTLGHDKGDLLLQEVARRLKRSVRRSNTVARLGGDEFVVLLEGLSGDMNEAAAQTEIVAEKILASFNGAFYLCDYEHHCTPSIGVALFHRHQNDMDELLKRADLAMYQAKASGRNAVRFFDPWMQTMVNARVALDRELRSSLQNSEFVLHYQPQVDDHGHVIAAEALVRWCHPRRGLLFPQEFIPLAEESGLIFRLGHWILEAACLQLAAWEREPGPVVPRIAINVSARQFRHPDFVRQMVTVLEDTGVDPRNVKLELTESAILEHLDEAARKMLDLKHCGVSFSLDDFGTGYSSLSYLKQLPLDEIKIDQSFVHDILSDANGAAITKTIVSLGQILELDVVAEGVETEAQRSFLTNYGCHLFQGNLISPPLPASRLL